MQVPKKIIVHYDEIATKGKNRDKFEQALVDSLKGLVDKLDLDIHVLKNWGFITLISNNASLLEKLIESERLKYLPGIAYFGLAYSFEKEVDFISQAAQIAKEIDGTFRVSAKRIDKSFPLSSQEIEKELGARILDANPELKVSLKDFDNEVKVEVLNEEILVYLKEVGIAGLPIPISGRAVSLLSAGFDSPVASYMLMKRGVELYPIHFHASEKTGNEPLQAVEDLLKKLSKFQLKIKAAFVPVIEIQRYIAKGAPERLRIVLLRRSFNRMATLYAKQVSALALVTGESVGQVASQTLENMLVSENATDLPILRPLSGFNKNEIIEIARKIDTFNISSRPCEDTCSLFLPKYPETKAKLDEVIEVEKQLKDLHNLEKAALQNAEIKEF